MSWRRAAVGAVAVSVQLDNPRRGGPVTVRRIYTAAGPGSSPAQ